MTRFGFFVSGLLFCSGLCALVYQTAWMRLLRLIFGSSTASSAAVLAIFMGGLGVGAWWLGEKADRSMRPLRLYGHLEVGIALGALCSPILAAYARDLYIGLGGTLVWGDFWGGGWRVLCAFLVLGVPAFLMGGTLPAVVRAVESAQDVSRRNIGFLYGANTLGAVVGALLATFFCFEWLGIRWTLVLFSSLNLCLALLAYALSFRYEANETVVAPEFAGTNEAKEEINKDFVQEDLSTNLVKKGAFQELVQEDAKVSNALALGGGERPRGFILFAAAVVGFVFFLSETLWYRALSPLLGGSTFSFGLILAVALGGIGLGGFLYAGWGKKEATLWGFALTCGAEAIFLLLPYAWGDGLASLAASLQYVGDLGFGWLVGVWLFLAMLLVLPVSVIAGFQFPLLIALLGKGREDVGRDVGHAYLWNTAGSILGAMAGGFGLLPLLSLNGVWRMAAVILFVLALLAAFFAERQQHSSFALGSFGALSLGCLFLLQAPGPSSFWRHQPIGARRYRAPPKESPNQRTNRVRQLRRSVVWEKDGIEASVALTVNAAHGYSQITNGKSDGNIVLDGQTTVLLGLLGSLLHADAKRILVIGLGTGMSAGWAAEAPHTERVDVFEMEPAVLHVAEACAQVNFHVHKHKKVKIYQGDARELLVVNKEKYDIVISEPSNPYRAGVLSLFTKEYYKDIKKKLSSKGLFVQWLQAYEIEPEVLQIFIATVREVFPFVEVWSGSFSDLILVGHLQRPNYQHAALAEKIRHPIYQKAQRIFWGTEGVDSLFSNYIATPALADAFWKRHRHQINTDDQSKVEYRMVRAQALPHRSVGSRELLALSAQMETQKPPLHGGAAWTQDRFFEMRSIALARQEGKGVLMNGLSKGVAMRAGAREVFRKKDYDQARYLWSVAPNKPTVIQPMDLLMEAFLFLGDASFEQRLRRLETVYPTDALLLRGLNALLRKEWTSAVAFLKKAAVALQKSPWVFQPLATKTFREAVLIARADAQFGRELFSVFLKPFSGHILDAERRAFLYETAYYSGFWDLCLSLYQGREEETRWESKALKVRALCYKYHKDKRYQEAENALKAFQNAEGSRLADGFVPPKPFGMPPRPRFLVRSPSLRAVQPSTRPSLR